MNEKMNLQLFADPVQGSKIVWLLRLLSDKTTKDGTILAFQTEGSNSISKDADTTATKDGPIRVPGATEEEVNLSSLMKKGDAMIDTLKAAARKGSKIEYWQVNMDEKGTDTNSSKYKCEYGQGYLTSFEISATAEDFTEISITIGVEGTPQDGFATLSAEQEEQAQYVFADIPAAS